MSNYTELNIYKKQMKQLKLNTLQYSKLLEMPYEIVKDIIYDKKGDYSMEISKLLRKNMFEKHQLIENNIDEAKLKAMEIKANEVDDKIDYLEWYDKNYTFEELKKVCNINSTPEFEKKYNIIINDKKASNWFYSCIVNKTNYKERHLNEYSLYQFVKQLYDIIENNNKEKYYTNEIIENENKNEMLDENQKWFKNFALKKYIKDNNLITNDVIKELKIAPATFYKLQAKDIYSKANCKKVKEWYDNRENKIVIDKDRILNENIDINKEVKNISSSNELAENTEKEVSKSIVPEIKIINNNDILRKILINRLTEEEKELIRIFDGKLC